MKVEFAPNENGQKPTKKRPDREGHEGWAGRVKNFQKAAMLKRRRWTVSQRQPESEEARPVTPGERAVKSGG